MSDLYKHSRNTAFSKVIFWHPQYCQLSRFLYDKRKYAHETFMIIVGLKAREEKTQITVPSPGSKMATPPYASAKACIIHSVPKSDISDIQVAMTQPGCLVMEFASLPPTLPSHWNQHPFFFTVPTSSPCSPQFQISLQHKENRVQMNSHSYHKKYLSSWIQLPSNFFLKSCMNCTALYV